MITRRIIHAFDAGPALALQPLGLEKRFHGWRGKSGRRYLSTIFVGASARHLGEGIYLLIHRDQADDLVPLRVGIMTGEDAVALAQLHGAGEIHVIFPAPAMQERIAADLASQIRPDAETCACQPERLSSPDAGHSGQEAQCSRPS